MADSLLRRIASGDAAATRDTIERYGGLVWSLARRFSSSESDAEDAVQEIFLDVWKSAGRFDPSVASELTFVAMIARRRLIDRRRRAARRPESELPQDREIAQETDSRPAGEISEEAARAQKALAMLSPEQQRVLRLSIMHGYSHEGIARITGLPLGTVKTHARRGLIRIREILESWKVSSPAAAPR
ncbi:MAG: sigma-70 family RNA polymerase sigma factor [Phycisphaerales bacterium]|nr:sigma-70 family RNA polymerase sigma factor [Phycisphaerales bacterium]